MTECLSRTPNACYPFASASDWCRMQGAAVDAGRAKIATREM
jgi:hypothetical protein